MTQVLINGIPHDILGETQDRQGALLIIARPRGVKCHLARRLQDHPVYGENRAVIIASAGWRTP